MLRVDFINDEGVVQFKMDIDSDTTLVAMVKMVRAILEYSNIELVIVDGIRINVDGSNHATTAIEVAKAWSFCANTKRSLLWAAENGTLSKKLNEMYLQDRI